MDLLGIDLRERRSKVKIVMLTQIDNTDWTPREISVLVANLKPMAVVNQHPQHKGIALIQGGPWSEGGIEKILGHNRFKYEVVDGLDNPRLPFKPQI